MSSSLHYFIEAKDKNGRWNVVKTLSKSETKKMDNYENYPTFNDNFEFISNLDFRDFVKTKMDGIMSSAIDSSADVIYLLIRTELYENHSANEFYKIVSLSDLYKSIDRYLEKFENNSKKINDDRNFSILNDKLNIIGQYVTNNVEFGYNDKLENDSIYEEFNDDLNHIINVYSELSYIDKTAKIYLNDNYISPEDIRIYFWIY